MKALHLGALWAFAFVQPLFDLLGKDATFFIVRDSTVGDILVFAFAFAASEAVGFFERRVAAYATSR